MPNKTTDAIEIVAAAKARAVEAKASAADVIDAINIEAAQAKASAAQAEAKAAEAKARADEEMYAINIKAAQAEARENLRKKTAEAERALLLLEQDTRNGKCSILSCFFIIRHLLMHSVKASSSSRTSPVCRVPTPPVTASPSSSPSGYSPSPRPQRMSSMIITPFLPNSSREEYVRRVIGLCEPVWTVSSDDDSLVFRLTDASASQTGQETIYLPEACQVRNLWRTLLELKRKGSDIQTTFSTVFCQPDKIINYDREVSP